jgi:AcrR family transcriptional regulator
MARPSRQADIRRAALSCFARLGYDGTRTRQIAEEAGVSEAALYRHWRSKEDLAAELFADGMRAYAADLEAAAGAPAPTSQRLTGVIRRMLELYREQPHLSVFLIEQQPRFIAALPARFPYPLHVFERVVKAGQRKQEVKRGDPRLIAAIALGCATRPILVSRYSQRWELDADDPRQMELIAESAWEAIRRRPSSPTTTR